MTPERTTPARTTSEPDDRPACSQDRSAVDDETDGVRRSSPDGFSRSTLHLELRAELDRVRLENQRLRARLADVASLRALAVGAAGRLVLAARRLPILLRRKLARTRQAGPQAAPPYVVRRLHAPTAPRSRVLHVIANFHLGGSSRLVVDLVEHLGGDYEQEVVSYDLPPSPAYVGLRLTRVGLQDAGHVARFLESRKPTLIHVHYLVRMDTRTDRHGSYDDRVWRWYHSFFSAAERLGIPVIENINIPTEPYVSDAVHSYAHVSDYVRQRFGRLDGRHLAIHPGSDMGMFRRPPGAAPAGDCVGMVYRLEGDKLDENAIQPFIEIVRRRPTTRALIVGGGRFLDQYRAEVARAGLSDSFTFTGYVPYDALPGLLARMSVFVAPVHTESFGQVSPFAMGLELPVVGYDVGALGEILGDSSLLVPAGDVGRLADIAIDLLDDPERRRRVGAANRERAERMFSVEAMVAAYRALYDEVSRGTAPASSRAGGS